MIRALLNIRPGIVLFTLLWCWSASVSADELYFVHTDHLGTPQVITDANQQTVWEGQRLPFGETDISTSQIEYNLRFPGQYYDQESGLHYNYFRDYDPSLGRYVQSDPIGLKGGLNTYGYVKQTPSNAIDPLGLNSANRHILNQAAKGEMSEVHTILTNTIGQGSKEMAKIARQCAQKRAKTLLEQFKKEGVGTGARSGQHGTPHKRAGAELIREANALPKGPLRDAMKREGERLIQQGRSHNHR